MPGSISIHKAAAAGDTTTVRRLLVATPALANTYDAQGSTPLHRAARNGHLEIAQLLIAHGADVNATDLEHATALHHAADGGFLVNGKELIGLLVEHGADVNLRNAAGWTPLDRVRATLVHLPEDLPQRSHYMEMASMLLLNGATISGEALTAAHTADLPAMLRALDSPAPPLERHFLLQAIVDLTFHQRKADDEMLRVCERIAWQYLEEFPTLAPALADAYREGETPTLPPITSFVQLAVLLAEQGRFAQAITVSECALKFGVEDGTKTGFAGRIRRLRKKLNAYPACEETPEPVPPPAEPILATTGAAESKGWFSDLFHAVRRIFPGTP